MLPACIAGHRASDCERWRRCGFNLQLLPRVKRHVLLDLERLSILKDKISLCSTCISAIEQTATEAAPRVIDDLILVCDFIVARVSQSIMSKELFSRNHILCRPEYVQKVVNVSAFTLGVHIGVGANFASVQTSEDDDLCSTRISDTEQTAAPRVIDNVVWYQLQPLTLQYVSS